MKITNNIVRHDSTPTHEHGLQQDKWHQDYVKKKGISVTRRGLQCSSLRADVFEFFCRGFHLLTLVLLAEDLPDPRRDPATPQHRVVRGIGLSCAAAAPPARPPLDEPGSKLVRPGSKLVHFVNGRLPRSHDTVVANMFILTNAYLLPRGLQIFLGTLQIFLGTEVGGNSVSICAEEEDCRSRN